MIFFLAKLFVEIALLNGYTYLLTKRINGLGINDLNRLLLKSIEDKYSSIPIKSAFTSCMGDLSK